MAGAGEACSHIAATLYVIVTGIRLAREKHHVHQFVASGLSLLILERYEICSHAVL